MKKLIILLLLTYSCYCTMEECDECDDQTKCNSIEVEYDDFYCFKANFFGEGTGCISYPKEGEYQKAYWNLFSGFIKEMFSISGSELKETKDLAEEMFEFISQSILNTEKETYNINEEVKIIHDTLTERDKEVILSGKTCSYYLYGRYEESASEEYENIVDKNICFNAEQIDDLKNLVDCGYATMKFSIDGEDYEIKTCYFLPNDNMPKNFSDLYMESIQTSIDGDFNIVEQLFYSIAGKSDDIRRLSTMTYEIEVENKKGKKVKYSSDTVISKAGKSQDGDGNTYEGNASYVNINFILLILFLFL